MSGVSDSSNKDENMSDSLESITMAPPPPTSNSSGSQGEEAKVGDEDLSMPSPSVAFLKDDSSSNDSGIPCGQFKSEEEQKFVAEMIDDMQSSQQLKSLARVALKKAIATGRAKLGKKQPSSKLAEIVHRVEEIKGGVKKAKESMKQVKEITQALKEKLREAATTFSTVVSGGKLYGGILLLKKSD